NIGDDCAIFEAVHGSAPDIAGKGIANPLSLLMSSLMMLRHIAKTKDDPSLNGIADRIDAAYNQALVDDQKTGDLGGTLNTEAFVKAVIERLP
ncbi:MAG: isocitrate/isopropylmalate family dehydrogenase, partial [Myxococcota bacterium]